MFHLSPAQLFVQSLSRVPDPRSKHGVSQPFRTVIAITVLGLLANLSTIAKIERWTKLHFSQLQQIVRFRKTEFLPTIPSACICRRTSFTVRRADVEESTGTNSSKSVKRHKKSGNLKTD